jgi:hypothetical protein
MGRPLVPGNERLQLSYVFPTYTLVQRKEHVLISMFSEFSASVPSDQPEPEIRSGHFA